MSREELKARILATARPRPIPVDVPEWGAVFVRPLLVGEIEGMSADADPKLQTARGIARMLCDEGGELIFDPADPADLFAINGLPATSLSRINDAMEKVNGMGKAAEELGNGSPREIASS